MSGELWAGLATALVMLLTALIAIPKMRADTRKADAETPKARAEARLADAEAGRINWQTLRDEINRLQERVEAQDSRIAELEKLDHERADREVGLKRENQQLRQKVSKLETRITGLEAIFKIGPTPPEMQAQLDELNRKTGGRS